MLADDIKEFIDEESNKIDEEASKIGTQEKYLAILKELEKKYEI